MPTMTVVIILIILQGTPVDPPPMPPRPTKQDSWETARPDRPSHVGGGSWRKSVSPTWRAGAMATLGPRHPSVMAFPVLPGFGGLPPEGNLLRSSESSRAVKSSSPKASPQAPGPARLPTPYPPPQSRQWSRAAPEGSDPQFPAIVSLKLPPPLPYFGPPLPKAPVSGQASPQRHLTR